MNCICLDKGSDVLRDFVHDYIMKEMIIQWNQ
jgi:hypothetical protein